jgi:hypothetical protein
MAKRIQGIEEREPVVEQIHKQKMRDETKEAGANAVSHAMEAAL